MTEEGEEEGKPTRPTLCADSEPEIVASFDASFPTGRSVIEAAGAQPGDIIPGDALEGNARTERVNVQYFLPFFPFFLLFLPP